MIPIELTQYPQWVNWRYEDDGNGKPTKVPYHAPSGHLASVTDPRTWCDYATACAAMSTGFYAGIGFVLTDNDPYTFIDLDNPYKDVTPAEGAIIAARHNKVLAMMDSYAEWSPSGTGMHVIVKGRVPEGRRRAKIEVYSNKRYMTVTGITVIDKPIADRMDILSMFYAELGKNKVDVAVVDSPETQTDFAIWQMGSEAKNGDKFVQLWNGEYQGLYASQSEADFGLINMLGFYSRNKIQIERMFMKSGLGHRLATGAKKKARNYIPTMIQRSFDNQLPDVDFSQLRMDAEKAVEPKKERLPAPEPLKWEMPPGLLGEITQFIYEAAPLPVPEVALAGALAMMAGIVGRAYNVSDEGLNLYILVLALTGTGKEAAAKGIGKLMDRVEINVPAAAEFRGPAEIASGPGLTKHLAEKAPACFSILGEFGLRLHQMCNDNAQSHMVGLRRILLDLFHKSGKSSSLRPHVYSDRDKNTAVLYSPAYTILGESTPNTFYRHLDESMVSDGLLPRFTIIEYMGDRVDINQKFMDAKPSEQLVTKVSELCTYCLQMHSAKRVLDVQFDADAQVLYWDIATEYTRRINQNRDDDVARQLLNRAHIKIMKMAAIIAVGVNPIRPTIIVSYIEWGKAMVDRDIANIMHKFRSGRVGRETGDINQINDMTDIIAAYMKRPYDAVMTKYKVMPEMKAANVVPYQYLLRQCGARSAFRADKAGATFAIRRAIDALISEGGLREIKTHILEKEFGSTMKAYAIIDPTMFQ